MDVREARVEDAEQVREVHYESIRELGKQAYSQEQVDAWASGCKSADYVSSIEADSGEFIVAETNGEIVGFGSLNLDPPDEYPSEGEAEVTAVYVRPATAREGVGTAIYSELERRARAHGVTVLGLSASLNAVPFYEAHGYERVRESEHEFSSHEGTGVTGMIVVMRKEL